MDGESRGGGKYSMKDLGVVEKCRCVRRQEEHLRPLVVSGADETKALETACESFAVEA